MMPVEEQLEFSEFTGVHTPEIDEDDEASDKAAEGQVRERREPVTVNSTKEVYDELQYAYDLFNRELFDGKLPGALITVSRRKNAKGVFYPGRYTNRDGTLSDEIAMNPEFFAVRSVEEVLSTLCHEQCHQYQFYFAEKDFKSGYHNKEFADIMEKVGLITSHTGYPGGDRVGEKMTHYIAEEGAFIKVVRDLLKTRLGIVWYDRYPNPKLLRAPTLTDIQDAEDERKMLQDEVERELEKQGKKKSNRGRKKTPISKAVPATVSTPAIINEPKLIEAIGVKVEHADPVDRIIDPNMHAQKIAARIVKQQEVKAKTGKRVKYSCPSCQDSVWGKKEMTLICGREGCNHARFVDAKELSQPEMDDEDDIDAGVSNAVTAPGEAEPAG